MLHMTWHASSLYESYDTIYQYISTCFRPKMIHIILLGQETYLSLIKFIIEKILLTFITSNTYTIKCIIIT
jgi:hypothetical protein